MLEVYACYEDCEDSTVLLVGLCEDVCVLPFVLVWVEIGCVLEGLFWCWVVCRVWVFPFSLCVNLVEYVMCLVCVLSSYD